jgi:hypothetical protein
MHYNNAHMCVIMLAFDQKKIRQNPLSGSKVMNKCKFFTHKCVNFTHKCVKFTLNMHYSNAHMCVMMQAFDQKKIRQNPLSGSKVMNKCKFFTHKCVNFTHKCVKFTLNMHYNNAHMCVMMQAFDQKKILQNPLSGSKVMNKCNFLHINV